MRVLTVVTLTSLAALASGAAWADSTGGDLPTVPTARQTEINLEVGGMYDSNEARSDRKLAESRHLALSDEYGTPSGELLVARPFGPTMLFLKVDGGYDFHRVNTVRNTDHVYTAGGAGLQLLRCHESVVGDFSQTQSDLADLSATAVSNTKQHEGLSFSARCGRQVGLGEQFDFVKDWSSNSDPQLREINVNTTTYTGSLVYQRPVFGSLAFFGSYVTATYPERFASPGQQGLAYGYQLYSVGVKASRPVGGRLSFDLSASYTNLATNSATGRNFQGLTYSADGIWNLTHRLAWHVMIERATNPTNRLDTNYSVSQNYQTDWTLTLSRRLSLNLQLDSRTADYIGITGLVSHEDLTAETTYDADFSVTYNLTRRLSVELKVGDQERHANLSELSYSSTTGGMTLKATF